MFFILCFSNINLNFAPKIPKKSEFLAANSDLDTIVVKRGFIASNDDDNDDDDNDDDNNDDNDYDMTMMII